MTDQRQRMKRAQTSPRSGINSLINAANRNDRFKLLEDDAVLPANLVNPIHPVFRQLEGETQLYLGLQLASHFLLHDRLLEFFVPLLFGHESVDLRSNKSYLCDPSVKASKAEQASLLSAVRKALQSLAQRVEICFSSHKKECLKVYPRIEITDKFLQFYNSADGYTAASRCAQFRHDFLFATTLVHEIVHAVGVMRRGNLTEPHYRPDFPETEWGYAWENFMFGSIFNPQDKAKLGTHLLMRKVWADAKVADAKGGKEYCDVSMSWIAQWFRNETWEIVASQGPTAIALPTTHFKIQISHEFGAWIVSSDCSDVRKDISALWKRWQRHGRHLKAEEPPVNGRGTSHKIYYKTRKMVELQVSNVPIPQRTHGPIPQRTHGQLDQQAVVLRLLATAKTKDSTARQKAGAYKQLNAAKAPLVAVCRAASPYKTRKRRVDIQDDDLSPTTVKRVRTEPGV
ncbi:hypothetical protein EJ07DRAFT_100297 [Lizonia empirigonia]|nr:hypothetical protein EJ07DRAFT_100297 [Lizonia empirigonia]